MTLRGCLATHRSRRQRGQTLVEFALVATMMLFLFFAVLEGSLLVFTMGAFRYAASQGALQDAELGNAAYADTQQSSSPSGAIQVIQASPGVTTLATVTEIDIYRLTEQSNGQLAVDTSNYNKYKADGTVISVTWSPSARNTRQGFTDFLGVTINYTYTWKSGSLLGAQPLQLTQTSYVRLEPQSY